MSAPDTNIEKQTKRHRPAIYGILAALMVAACAVIVFNLWGGVPSDEQAAPTTAPVVQQ